MDSIIEHEKQQRNSRLYGEEERALIQEGAIFHPIPIYGKMS